MDEASPLLAPQAARIGPAPPDETAVSSVALDQARRVSFATARLRDVLTDAAPGPDLGSVWQYARWTLRRWSLRHMIYRLRLPARRRRWAFERDRRTSRHGKSHDARRTNGPAVAFGEFSGNHGLGRAAAYDIEALRGRHSRLTLVDIGPYLHDPEPQPISFDHPIENVYFLCQPDTYGTVCDLVAPADIAGAWRLGRWVWETPLFPGEWRFAQNLVHEVWTPSAFCAETFRRALDIPVDVVPHAVEPPPETSIDMRARLGLSSGQVLGVAIMDIRSCPERKNPWAHIRAWKRAFGGDAQFQLVMKLRVGKRTRMVLDELRDLIGTDSNIRLLTDDLSDDEIAALHRAADLYLSLHRSEGFGLNIYEALLLGKPVLATHFSANAEYGPSFPNYVPIPAKMAPYRDWTGHYVDRDFQWATTAAS